MTPDHSQFTASMLGEVAPETRQACEEALRQDPSLQAEAEAIRLTATRLTRALKQEPAVFLTAARRHAVLHPPLAAAAAAARQVSRRSGRPAWMMPTLSTLGLAAAAAVGIFMMPDGRPSGSPQGGTGIPSVAIQPAAPGLKSGAMPASPPPSVAGHNAVPGLPPDTLPTGIPSATSSGNGSNSGTINGTGTMAATPPILEGLPFPSRQPGEVLEEILPSGKPPKPTPPIPGNLASPPRPPQR